MQKRTKLSQRNLPRYSKAEEITNMITHIVGGVLGILALCLCIFLTNTALATTGACIYGSSMIALYTVSSVYHGMHPGTGKKVMQILDHCTIYFLICGTYTVIMTSAMIPVFPAVGWGILAAQWVLAALAITLTAIDLRKYRVFSMACYIFLGWMILFFLPQALEALGRISFAFLLAGGIVYTLGAILYGIGAKLPWFHSIFHIFVVVGSFLQLVSILLFLI